MTDNNIISIKRPLAVHLFDLLKKSEQQQICGFIGSGAAGKSCYPLAGNSQADFATAMAQIEKQQQQVFAYYQTLSATQSAPVAADFAKLPPNIYFLAVLTKVKGVIEIAAFKLEQQQIVAVDLTI